MSDIRFCLAEDESSVELRVYSFAQPIPDADTLKQLFLESEFGACFFLEENVPKIIKALSGLAPPLKEEDKVDENQEDAELVLLAEPLISPIAEKRDAQLEIRVTPDKLQATAHLVTAWGGKNIGKQLIVGALEELNINKGVKKASLIKLCSESLSAAPGGEIEMILAEGLSPEPGIPTQFNYLVTPLQDRVLVPQERDDGSVDMHDMGEIEMVNPGDKLLMRTPSKAGADGFNIEGEVLPSIKPNDIEFVIEEGVEISEDDPLLLVANKMGVPLRITNGIIVTEVLPLDEVNLASGNIDFDGTVIVKHNVAKGMLVKATKAVVVGGTVESATIEAGGNISVAKGVIGSEQNVDNRELDVESLTARLIAGESIKVQFAQFSCLEANENVEATSQLLHCHAIAKNSVLVGERGQKKPKLVGGVIEAHHHVAAGTIGTPAGSKITICLSGKINELHAELTKIAKEKADKELFLEDLVYASKRMQLRKMVPELKEKQDRLVKTIEHTKTELGEMQESEAAIETEMQEVKDALQVEVYGSIYPGVAFKICKDSYLVKNEMASSTIRFDDQEMTFNGAS